MRIALINPCADRKLQTHRHGVGHLGLGYVAACLLQDGHDVQVIDAKHEKLSPEAIVARVAEHAPAMVGLTAMTHEICEAADLSAAIKQAMPDCIAMVGGPHTSALPERTLREFPAIDVAIRGEGEQTARELANAMAGDAVRREWAAIAGLAFRDGERVHMTADRPVCADLDSLPFPAWELFPRDVSWPIYAGRGCPFRCTFCQRVLGGRIRLRSVDNVLAEMNALEEWTGLCTSWFQDETFGTSRRWTHELLDRMIERNARRGRVWHWKANSRANLADLDLYRKMRLAGCRELDFGIESGCPEILKRVNKGITLDSARGAICSAKAAGLRTNAFFIIGHPGETWGTAMQTVRFARSVGADDIAVAVMGPYPGTAVWDLAQRGAWGYKLLSEDWRGYDKYFGNALEIRGLSPRKLDLLQIMTYVWFNLSRARLGNLWEMGWRFRREAWQMIKRLARFPLSSRSPSSTASALHTG